MGALVRSIKKMQGSISGFIPFIELCIFVLIKKTYLEAKASASSISGESVIIFLF